MKSNANKIVELEGIRGLAAMYVFVHHAHLLPNKGVGSLLYFGQEAVIVFFLLSGFVICYSSANKHLSAGEYLLHRIKRIYPIFIVSLLMAYCAKSIVAGHAVGVNLRELAGNLVMLQDVSELKRGVSFGTFCGNTPLWSLSYEWWFYLLFIPLGLNKAVRGGWSAFMAMAVSIAGFVMYQASPNQPSLIAGYFFIWWAGVELAREYAATGRVSFAGQRGTLAGMLVMTVLWGVPVFMQVMEHIHLKPGVDPVLQFRHQLSALVFAFMGIWIASRNIQLGWTVSWFAKIAPVSYAIYVIHEPVLKVVHFMVGMEPGWLAALIALPIVLILSWLLEVRFQRWVNAKFFPKPAKIGNAVALAAAA